MQHYVMMQGSTESILLAYVSENLNVQLWNIICNLSKHLLHKQTLLICYKQAEMKSYCI